MYTDRKIYDLCLVDDGRVYVKDPARHVTVAKTEADGQECGQHLIDLTNDRVIRPVRVRLGMEVVACRDVLVGLEEKKPRDPVLAEQRQTSRGVEK